MSTELAVFAGVTQAEIDDIRQLQSEILVAVKMTIDKVIDAGGKLSAVRAKLKHGQWMPFVEHLEIDHQTASNYIGVWEKRDEIKIRNIRNLTEAYRLSRPSKKAAPSVQKVKEEAEPTSWTVPQSTVTESEIVTPDPVTREGTYNPDEDPCIISETDCARDTRVIGQVNDAVRELIDKLKKTVLRRDYWLAMDTLINHDTCIDAFREVRVELQAFEHARSIVILEKREQEKEERQKEKRAAAKLAKTRIQEVQA